MMDGFVSCRHDELYHHGILNMRWGVRRYQNADGTLTEAGRARYSREDSHDPKDWVKKDMNNSKNLLEKTSSVSSSLSNAVKAYPTPKKEAIKKNLSDYTDEELQSVIKRESLERKWNELFNSVSQTDIEKGKQKAVEALDMASKVAATGASIVGLALAVQQLKNGG